MRFCTQESFTICMPLTILLNCLAFLKEVLLALHFSVMVLPVTASWCLVFLPIPYSLTCLFIERAFICDICLWEANFWYALPTLSTCQFSTVISCSEHFLLCMIMPSTVMSFLPYTGTSPTRSRPTRVCFLLSVVVQCTNTPQNPLRITRQLSDVGQARVTYI